MSSRGVRHAVLLALLVGCTFNVEVGKSAFQNVNNDDAGQLDSNAAERQMANVNPPQPPPQDAGLQGGASGQGGAAGAGGMRLVDGGVAGTGGTSAGGSAGMGAGGSPMVDAGSVAPATCTPNVAATSQLAFFDFNEGKGSVIGNRLGNDGSFSPAPTNWIPGVAGGAVAFKLNAVIAPSYPLLDETGIGNVVSLSAWVKVDSISPGAQSILSRAELGSDFEHFGLALVDGRPALRVHFFSITSTEVLPVGRWVNLAATYDGITGSIYVDAKPSATLDIGWPMAVDTTALVLGARQDAKGKLVDHFLGALDEVKVYKQVLTTADIAALAVCK